MKPLRMILLTLCMATALALAADAVRTPAQPFKFRETWAEGIPKAWGHLIHVNMFSDGITGFMYFEAADGTIRRVGIKVTPTGVQYAAHVIVFPRP